jgi:hypothetical protein
MSKTDEDWCDDYNELESKYDHLTKLFADTCEETSNRINLFKGRAASWKKLAKQYKQTFEHFSARPGQMLALMMLEAETKDTPIGNMAAECMAWALQALLIKNPQAKNYVEVTLDAPDGSQFFVTIQRPDGKTPNQLKDEALKERDAALAEVESLREVVQQDLIEYTKLHDKMAYSSAFCSKAPYGWWCSREPGHDGPCAARPNE